MDGVLTMGMVRVWHTVCGGMAGVIEKCACDSEEMVKVSAEGCVRSRHE